MIEENREKVTSVLYGFCGPDKAYKSVRYDVFREGDLVTPSVLEQAASLMKRINPSIKEVYWIENSWHLGPDWVYQLKSTIESVSINFYMDVKKSGYLINA